VHSVGRDEKCIFVKISSLKKEILAAANRHSGSFKSLGRVPDFDAWHPVDLILTKDKRPDAISKAIQRIQEPGYGSKHAEWTHAAIYLGDRLCYVKPNLIRRRVYSTSLSPIVGIILAHMIFW
jgi:hypothetical protein